MALDFPTSPTPGQKFPTTPQAGIPTYTWDGVKWTTSGPSLGIYVQKAGDTMTGALAVTTAVANGGPINGELRLENTNSGSVGSVLNIYHNSPGPAVGNIPAVIGLQGNNSASARISYSQLTTLINNKTVGAEDANLGFWIRAAGAMVNQFSVTPTGIFLVPNSTILLGTANITPREKLTAARTYFVRPDGNDANNGSTNDAAGAFLTISAAFTYLKRSVDTGSNAVTIQLADGTYTAGINTGSGWTGGNNFAIQGNVATPANVLISTTSASCFSFSGSIPGAITLSGMKLVSSGAACINQAGGGVLNIANVIFGGPSAAHILASSNGIVNIIGNYSIDGSAPSHWQAVDGGRIVCLGGAVTLIGTPAFSAAFAVADTSGSIRATSMTFGGTATGLRYSILSNAVIQTGGAAATYLPGSAAGVVGTGGQYV